jgi:hypothetical protein
MKNQTKAAAQMLLEKELITEDQFKNIESYHKLHIFSLHTELRLLLYLSVLLFTSGIGIIIYQNIDTIGHIAILTFILMTIVICFYLCFKNSAAYKNEETEFTNPIFNYVLLAANLLTCIFIGYLQFQYNVFGTYYGLVTLLPTLIAFFSAYYFDNRSILSIGLTGLAAYIGLSVSPQVILSGNLFNIGPPWLSLSAIGLGVAIILWSMYAEKKHIKTHFQFVYVTFSFHLISLAIINNCDGQFWLFAVIALFGSVFYFYKISTKIPAISIFAFNVLYAFFGFNVLLGKLFSVLSIWTDFEGFWIPLVILSPIYLIISIVLFIKAIKNFNKNKRNENL